MSWIRIRLSAWFSTRMIAVSPVTTIAPMAAPATATASTGDSSLRGRTDDRDAHDSEGHVGMCGIVGYAGSRDAISFLIPGLRRLEYRGYDSAGIATINGVGLELWKTAGKIAALEALLPPGRPRGTLGIAHTRWATHGRPSDANAHPHADCAGRLAIVHNGIIENYS